MTAEVLGRAEALIGRANVRALDALHLASAIAVDAALNAPARRLPLITVDDRQQARAQAFGMQRATVD